MRSHGGRSMLSPMTNSQYLWMIASDAIPLGDETPLLTACGSGPRTRAQRKATRPARLDCPADDRVIRLRFDRVLRRTVELLRHP